MTTHPEDMEIIEETTEVDEKSAEEKFMDMAMPWTPFTDFDEMEDAESAQEKAREIRHLAQVMPSMIDNVVADDDIDADSGITKIFNGFKARFNKIMNRNEDEKKETVEEKEEEPKATSSFMVYKDADGNYLWLSAYSNNIRDDDNPPEIIASESHENFVKMVDDGEAELPELWLWHTPQLVLGKSTAVAYDADSGFAIATGYFNKNAEPVAIAIEESDIEWGVSHGMPSKHIVRSEDDPSIILRHVTTEISPLPLSVAANKFANFSILKEANMTLSEDKKRELTESGIPEDALDALLESNKKVSDGVDNDGLERKEVETDETETKVVVEEETAFSPEQYSELEQVVKALTKELPEVIAKIVDQKLEPITSELAEKKKDLEEQVKETIANTPPASLQDILSGSIFAELSATKSEDTKVDGRTRLAKSAPEEADDSDADDLNIHTGKGFVDDIIKGVVSGEHMKLGAS